MNTSDKVDKVVKAISIPMLIMCVASGAADFQNGNICWGIIMALCSAWWIFMIYKHFISKKQ